MHAALEAFLAQSAPAEPAGPNPLILIVAFVAIFYFVVFRPQSKQAKAHQKFVAEMKKGDEVVTQAGIIGTIAQVDDRTVTLDVGGGNKLRVLKGQVAQAWQEKVEKPTEAKQEKK